VIVGQADMWDTSDALSHQTNYEPIIAAMASNAQTYGKPVLYINGDSHVYRADRSAEHGRRVVEGQRLTQAAGDIFLGWIHSDEEVEGGAHDFYVRQLWDWKVSADVETILPNGLASYAHACGWTLARAHARSGDRIAIAAYLGKSGRFDQAIAEFAAAYAERNQRDHRVSCSRLPIGRSPPSGGLATERHLPL